MFRAMVVESLALLVLVPYVFTSVTRIIEKRMPTRSTHSAQKNLSAS
jgi:hypothetical protein